MALTTVPASLSATALTLTTAAQPNITSVGTLTGLTVSGNIAGTLTTAAQTNITSVGTLSSLTVSGALNGTLSTAAQTNITSLGTLTGLTVSGNLTLSSASSPKITITDTTNTVSLLMYSQDADAIIGTYTNHPLKLFSNSGLALTLDTSQNATFAGTGTFAGGSTNNNDDANILTLNASEHARLLVDTSSTSGHRATLALESNGNELTLGTTGSYSYLGSVGNLEIDGGNVVINKSNFSSLPTGSKLNIFGDGVTLRLDGSSGTTKSILFRNVNAGNPGEVYADGSLRFRTEDASTRITFHTNSSGSNNERMRIDSSGYVGIGTSSPTDYIYGDLVIDGVTGSGNASGITLVSSNTSYGGIFFADGTSGDEKYRGYLQYNHNHTSLLDMLLFGTAAGTRMVLSSAGKLGLGTTDPQGDIHLLHGSTNAFTASNDSWHTIVLHNNAAAATNTTGIAFEVSGSGYHGNAGTGIAAVKNGTNSDYGADLVFVTRPQSAVAQERMRIDSSGNVGIGMTPVQSVGAPLQLQSSTGYVGLRLNGTGGYAHVWDLYASRNGNSDKIFGVYDRTNNVYRIAAVEDGNVGIGTTEPASKLHITTGNSTGEIRLSTSISHGSSGGTNNKLSFYNTANSASEMGSIRAVQHNQYTYGNLDVYVNNANSINHHTRFHYNGAVTVGSDTTSHTDETKVALFSSGGQLNVYSMAATNEWWIMNNLANNSGYTTKIDFRTQNASRGYIGITGSTVIYYSNSDYRLKENYNYDFDATSLVKAMKPLEFTWKNEPMVGKQMGFLAHELKEVTPYVVQGDKDEMREDGEIRPQVVDQGKLVAVLTKALQEALVRIETLETEVTALKG